MAYIMSLQRWRPVRWIAGWFTVVMLLGTILCVSAVAQQPVVHYLGDPGMPPGAIGQQQLRTDQPLAGYFQPVEIKVPDGAMVSTVTRGAFDPPVRDAKKVGMLIGRVYRLRVMHIHLQEGAEVYPTVEVIGRLYPPAGQELRFPIPIELTQRDLELAISGKLVTRIVYVENPRAAVPAADRSGQQWFEVSPERDPLAVADAMGRPIAIVRLGGRVPLDTTNPDPSFLYNSPPLMTYAFNRTQGTPGSPFQPAPASGPRGPAEDNMIPPTPAGQPVVPSDPVDRQTQYPSVRPASATYPTTRNSNPYYHR